MMFSQKSKNDIALEVAVKSQIEYIMVFGKPVFLEVLMDFVSTK